MFDFDGRALPELQEFTPDPDLKRSVWWAQEFEPNSDLTHTTTRK
jgi:hypothetical protein